jgi:eukaryotic-like serine/threonine-protein kinase
VLGVLTSKDVGAVTEALTALTKLADEQSYETVRARMLPLVASSEPTVASAARRAIGEIDALYRPSISQTGPRTTIGPGPGSLTGTGTSGTAIALGPLDVAHTMLVDSADIAAIVKAAETQAKLDISTLKAGDVLDNRYRFIEKIGKGAFGTVLLFEDTMVDERSSSSSSIRAYRRTRR